MAVEDGLDVGRVMDHLSGLTVATVLDEVAWLGLGGTGRASKCQGSFGTDSWNDVARFAVASAAGTHFAGLVVDVGPFALDFTEVFVECLEEDAAAGWDFEVGGTVFFDGDDAPIGLAARGHLSNWSY